MSAPSMDAAALREFDISVRMSRFGQVRTFHFTRIPAVDEDHARDAGHQLGLGINEGSDHQWKFNGAGVGDWVAVSESNPLCSDCGINSVRPGAWKDDDGGQLCTPCERSLG